MLKLLFSSALLVLSLVATAAAQTAASPPASVIVTMGEGVVKLAPDRAWVTIAAENRARTAQEAQRLNTDAMTAVIERIKGAGIAADAIQTSGYNLQPEFDYVNGRQTLRGYVARNQVNVRVDVLTKAGEVIAAAVATGATNVSGVRFELKDRDTHEREALRLAVQDARRRADAAARGAAVTIDRVIRVEEQRDMIDGPRPMQLNMAMMRQEGAPAAVPLEAGEIEVRSRVTLTVAIR